MSTATIAARPADTAGAAADPPQRAVRWALARVEGRRLLTHPLFMLGMAAAVLGLAIPGDRGEAISALGGDTFVYLGSGAATFLVACLAAGRERRDAAQDLYGAAPLAPRVRTEAALLSLGWAGLASAALIAVAALVLAGSDGVIVVDGQHYGLRPLELAQGPLYVLLMGALGVLVGTWTRRVYPAVVGALIVFLPPVAWLPWSVFGDGVPQGYSSDWVDHASVGWHVIGLGGLIAVVAAGALGRHDRRPRVALLFVAGLAVGVVGIVLGLPTGPDPL